MFFIYIVMLSTSDSLEDLRIFTSEHLKTFVALFIFLFFASIPGVSHGKKHDFFPGPQPVLVVTKTSSAPIDPKDAKLSSTMNAAELVDHILKSQNRAEARSYYLKFPQNRDVVHAYAIWLARNGFRKESLKIFEELVRKFPSGDKIKCDYVVVLVWDEQYAKAVQVYKTLGNSFEKPAYLYRNIGKAFYELGNFNRALFSYKEALIKDQNDTESRKGLILSLASLGKIKEALQQIAKLRKTTGVTSETLLLKAIVYEKNHRYLAAYKIYSDLYEKYPSIRENVIKREIHLFSSLSPEQINRVIDYLREVVESAPGCVSRYCQDYIVVLAMTGQYEKAISFRERRNLSKAELDPTTLSWLGWSYFKTGNLAEATSLYREAIRKKSDAIRPHIGLAYCFINQGKTRKAHELIKRILEKHPNNLEALFAKAYLFEKENKYWKAINIYDRILTLSPQNTAAFALKMRALSALGATSRALQMAKRRGFENKDLIRELEGDLAARFIHWKGDLPRALLILEKQLKEDPANLRALFDRLLAYYKKYEMAKVIKEYDKLKQRKVKIPYWVLKAVAGAYLYLEKPHMAIQIYREASKQNPKDFGIRLGLFYALQETRKWNEAEKILTELDTELPWIIKKDGVERENWDRYQVMIARGWLLLYEDRLEEAEDYFRRCLSKAPADTGTRTGLGFSHLWRGWPRKALEDFQVALNTVPEEDPDAKRGEAIALDTLAQKEEARRIASSLLKKNRNDKHNQELSRYFQVEDMKNLYGHVETNLEDTGADDIWVTLGAEVPLSLNTRMYTQGIWNRATFHDDEDYFRRLAIGLRHVINSTWAFNQEFSFDVSEIDKFGSATSLIYTPDDYWRVKASFNSFSLAIPLRARVHGTEGNEYKLAVTFRKSELDEYTCTGDYLHYTDGNDSVWVSVHGEHQVTTKPDFTARVFADISTAHNSKTSTPYFSPSGEFTSSITYMCRWVRYKLYRKSLVDRFFLTMGGYKQAGYSWSPVGSIRYEQDIDFSDTTSLNWGTEINRKVYDGDPVYAWELNVLFQHRF